MSSKGRNAFHKNGNRCQLFASGPPVQVEPVDLSLKSGPTASAPTASGTTASATTGSGTTASGPTASARLAPPFTPTAALCAQGAVWVATRVTAYRLKKTRGMKIRTVITLATNRLQHR
ncbi:hypothetical protein AAG570_004064 [Ranatra chinensis]|uniref:Uncharacterized protein n=1 Tax=Ranatra chinensis TaxID=642074 RepID=A0ABD0YPH1_9HEMI